MRTTRIPFDQMTGKQKLETYKLLVGTLTEMCENHPDPSVFNFWRNRAITLLGDLGELEEASPNAGGTGPSEEGA